MWRPIAKFANSRGEKLMKRTSVLVAFLLLTVAVAQRSVAAGPVAFEGSYAALAIGTTTGTPGTVVVVVRAAQGQSSVELVRAAQTTSTILSGTYVVSEGRLFMEITGIFVEGKLVGQVVDRDRRVPFHMTISSFGQVAVDVSGVLIRE